MDVRVRVAVRADLMPMRAALGAGHHAVLLARWPLQERRLGEILLADTGGRPVGTVFVSWAGAEEPLARELLAGVPAVFHLMVAPTHRGRGIGRRLLAAAEQRLRERGHTRVLLGVDESNRRARRWYDRLGYRPVPRLTGLGDGAGRYDILVADLHRR